MLGDQVISVTEASRNFAECVNLTRYQRVAFLLMKGGTPVARIVPVDEEPKVKPKARVSAGEFAAWQRANFKEGNH